MGKSSKEKICEAMYETDEFKALVNEARERLNSAKVIGYKGHYSDYERKSSIKVDFETDFCGAKKTETIDTTYVSLNQYWTLPRKLFISEASIEQVFNANFGILRPNSTKKYRVPTYNVNRDTALNAFKDKAESHLFCQVDSLAYSASAALAKQVASFMVTPEADKLKQDATDRYTIDTIKSVLLRFKNASPEVLRQATEEFVCASIMLD